MTWKNELDRVLSDAVAKGLDDEKPDWNRLQGLVADLVALAPSRAPSHFLAGVVEEARSAREAVPAAAPADAAGAPAGDVVPAAPAEPPRALPDSPAGDCALWRWLGRLDAASRARGPDRVLALCDEPALDDAVSRATEGRVALRAASRALLARGQEERLYALYARLLSTTSDDAAKKDAEWLLGDALRHADDLLSDAQPDAAVLRLTKALAFAKDAGLDARAVSKVERKLGRAHQLAGRWQDAAACYRASLDRLPADDRYRSVLHGDLALASLGVRGTLDLLPQEARPGAAEAEALLTQGGTHGEGESYNAIYTLGILAYERGEYAAAAERFREADRLMRETRAKARIVHARARFFLGASLLRLGAQGEDLRLAEQLVTRDAGPASLDPAVKDPILALVPAPIAVAAPAGRARGGASPRAERWEAAPPRGRGRDEGLAVHEGGGARGGRGFGREGAREGGAPRGDRADRGERPFPRTPMPRGPDHGRAAAPAPAADADSATHLAEAQAALESDPHRSLQAVDRAFKCRPGFEDWFSAYRLRLEALLRLGEAEEARRTYERFRAKLYERERADRLEALLADPSGPAARLFDPIALRAEQVDLYQAMPGREEAFVAACEGLAEALLARGSADDLRRAASVLREAVARGATRLRAAADDATARARAAGAPIEGPSQDEVRERLAARATPARVIVVGGDAAHRSQADRIQDLGRRIGFEGTWIPAGARPSHKTLADVESSARAGASAILVLHGIGTDLRAGVARLGTDLSVPVRELPWTGTAGIEPEVLSAIRDAL
jgi:hypothetical protein